MNDEHEPQFEFDGLIGRNSVIEALKAGRTINKILIAKGDSGGSIKQILALANEKRIVIQFVDRAKLDSMHLNRPHQGVVAMVSVKDYVEIEDILKAAEDKGEPPLVIILDGINDAGNLGAILRTADAVGAHGVIIPKRRAVALNFTVSRTSAGAVEYVPVARVTNITQAIETLKKSGLWIAGAAAGEGVEFYKGDYKGPTAIVIGGEGEGISRLVLEKCDYIINIPATGSISSLNASVACGIIMYEVFRQRHQGV